MTSSTSSGALSSRSDASSATWRRTSSAASWIAPPIDIVERLELVVWSQGASWVSGNTGRTRSKETPAASAASCASAVRDPWPTSVVPVSSDSEPSRFSRSVAVEVDGVTVPFAIAPSPRPRARVRETGARGRVQPISPATRSSISP